MYKISALKQVSTKNGIIVKTFCNTLTIASNGINVTTCEILSYDHLHTTSSCARISDQYPILKITYEDIWRMCRERSFPKGDDCITCRISYSVNCGDSETASGDKRKSYLYCLAILRSDSGLGRTPFVVVIEKFTLHHRVFLYECYVQ
jgi:hypothetical protein